jgi:hypothetical protein
LETLEPSCMIRTTKSFFIPVVHGPPGAVGHVASPKPPLRKAEPGAMGHVAASKFTSSRRQCPELRDT